MEKTSVNTVRRETASEKTRNLTKMALCVALMAISSYLAFPLPFTPAMVVGTTIIVNMTAFVLKPNDAFLVILAWLLIGAVGVPVLPGGAAAISFNTLTLPRDKLNRILEDSGFSVCTDDDLLHLRHEVEQAVVRDVIFAIR